MEVGGEHVRKGSELQGVKEPALPMQGSEVPGQVDGHTARLEGGCAQLRRRGIPEVAAAAREQGGEVLHAECHSSAERQHGRAEAQNSSVQRAPSSSRRAAAPQCESDSGEEAVAMRAQCGSLEAMHAAFHGNTAQQGGSHRPARQQTGAQTA